MPFTFTRLKIPDVILVTPKVFTDNRGYFMETYKRSDFFKNGIRQNFVQDNESSSTKGVIRGLHFQKKHTQAKLVRVTQGEVYDVAVDLRPNSPTYKKYIGVNLSDKNKNMLFIPEGFAHGFLVLSDTVTFTYKCSNIYDPESEYGIPWNDPIIDIEWPDINVKYNISEKDSYYTPFKLQNFQWAKKYYEKGTMFL